MVELKKIRIQNKYDTYENWMKSTKGLLAGEIAICVIPSQQTPTGLTPPAVGIKVGEDGVKTFAQLPWIQATAGDVAAWAKASTKPSYTASEIGGLEEFVIGQDTNTLYAFSYANDTLTIKSYAAGTDVEDAEVIATIPIDVSTKVNRVTDATEGNIVSFAKDGQVSDSGIAASAVALAANVVTKTEFKNAKDGLEASITKVAGDVATNASEITTIKGQITDMGSANTTALAGKADKVTGENLNGHVASLDASGNLVDGGVAVTDLAKSADVAATYVDKTTFKNAKDELESSISGVAGNVATNSGKITTLEGQVATLNGEGEGSVKKAAEDAANAAVNAFATEVTENGKIEKFAELVNWVATHGPEAAQMASAIQTNASDIEALQADITKLETKVGDANSGLTKGVADNAKAIEALEADISEIEGSAYASITADKISAWDKAVGDLATEVSERKAADGKLTSLTTTAKDNLVAAINEVKAATVTNATNISTNASDIEALQAEVSTVKATANNAVQSVSGVTATKTGTDVKITAVPSNLLVDGKETLVLYCGTASEVF